MVEREIIDIDHDLCDGCGDCIPACPEGAIQIIDGKARLINESFCDGLGACLQECPKNAIKIQKKEVEPYNEEKVIEKMVEQGPEVLKAHLQHLSNHGQTKLLETAIDHLKTLGVQPPKIKINEDLKPEIGCPGTKIQTNKQKISRKEVGSGQWPLQLSLVPVKAPYLDTDHLVFVADCVPPTYPNLHKEIIKGQPIVLGCPKLDDQQKYINKLTQILENNPIQKITSLHMEVPCCHGVNQIIEKAIKKTDREIETNEIVISIEGDRK
ncbi:4Fe-4S binding protein [Methanonatronarchaeum sp. AMET-Sl]|uniref:4Fe-4S binding protein n=1 Tax=Methanonatronarchaeum sp. AMET-Sl TaxID=3037654 RepID=UPI00244E1A26|nr:4Fe-4S binding protein [Methanonatronarchaeum sp. AMET-Sl]WGI16919.1 4Fe-4S binding protein [Methanonatronarchaeum sp. AMET-Sl]